jgi:hypothetical protein
MVSKSFSSLFLTLGVVAPLTGAVASTACSSKFEGCASSRSCPSDAGEGGDGGTAGKGGSGGQGGSAGKASGGAAGKGGSLSMGGEGGEDGSSAGKGGTGGTAGTSGGGSGSGGKAGQGGSSGSGTDPMGGEGGMEMEPEPQPDVTPPTIISVSPDDGENGVAADTVIRITFSEPMNRELTERAYQSADIPAAGTRFHWNTEDTELTITPNAELIYAEGAKGDLTFAAREYVLEMTDTAEDKAGNRLEVKEWSFSTLRRIAQVLTADGDDDVRRFNGTSNIGCTNMDLGDYRTNVPLAGFTQFHLSELAPGVTTFEVADFYGERVDSRGDPRLLDGVNLYEFEGDIMTVNLDTPTGQSLGLFLDSYTDVPHLSVLPAMTSSYADDGLIQIRMKVVPDSDGDGEDDFFRLTCAFDLSLVYLAP